MVPIDENELRSALRYVPHASAPDGLAEAAIGRGRTIRRRRRTLAAVGGTAATAVVAAALVLNLPGAVRQAVPAPQGQVPAAASPSAPGGADEPATGPIPAVAMLEPADFRRPMELLYSNGTYTNVPTVDGQLCNLDRGKARPTAGSQHLWAEQGVSGAKEYTAGLVISRWADGPGAMRDLQNNTGECLLGENRTVVTKSATEYDVALSEGSVFSARLVGNVIVATTVGRSEQSPGSAALLAEARDYTATVVDRLRAAGG